MDFNWATFFFGAITGAAVILGIALSIIVRLGVINSKNNE